MVRLTKKIPLVLSIGSALCFADNANTVCDASKMDAFAYEDCIAVQRGAKLDNTDFSE